MDRFVHLHCSSNFSLLYGATPVERLVERCADLGMDSIAVTDRDGLYAAVPFFESAEKAGIKAIIGLDLTVARDGPDEGAFRLVLLAKDDEGYSNLCRLATERHLGADRSSYEGAPVPFASLAGCSDGLFAMCREAGMLEELRGVYGGSLYAELVNDGSRACHREAEELIEAAGALGIECATTNAAAFATPEEHRLHLVVNAIRLICPVTRVPPGEAAGPQMYIKSGAEMREAFSCHPYTGAPRAIENAREIAEACHFRFDLNRRLFPAPDLPPGETAFSHLTKLCFAGAARRYRPLTSGALERLHHELDVIEGLGFTPYFLAVNDIASFCREQGIPAAGRGSAAGSMVAYVLGITYIDPLEHDLYFERFLSEAREDPPDIDLDVSWCRRDEVLEYIYRRFGHDRVAMICTYATMKPRMAVRDVSKALGLPPEEVDEFASNVPRWCKGSIEEAAAGRPSCDLPSNREPYRSILELCEMLDGFPRHLSVHAGGVVIADRPLTEMVPLERATKGLIISQFDMGPIEKLGLVKMDILGQKGLSVIVDTAKWAAADNGSSMDTDHLPRDDADTFRLLREGQTLGVFQIESPGMRSLLKAMKPRNIEDVTLSIALIRPGASGSGMKELFLLRRAGLEPVVYLHPDLEPILSESLGAFVYQEQVMKAAVALAGFTPAEADDLRRAMTKKRSPGKMEAIKESFIERAVSRGVPDKVALAVFESLAKFAGYGFPKAHAATYGEFSYQAAYLKAHHPAEFMAAVLCNEGGFYHHSVYVEEARRMGVRVALPDINRSEADYRVVGDALLFGLSRVKGISYNTVDAIMEARSSSLFTSLSDFLSRVDAEEGEVESLIKCGAFDPLENTRPELLWKLAMMFPQSKHSHRRDSEAAELPLGVDKVSPPAALPRLPDYCTSQKLAMELEYLEASVSCHPLEVVAPREVAATGMVSTDLEGRAGETVTLVGWLIARRRAVTKKNEYMQFLTLEDLSGTFEVIVFPDAYQRLGALINGARVLRVTGKVKDRAGSISIIASDIAPIA
jgi:DNA-directed DNA polymerase III PolC